MLLKVVYTCILFYNIICSRSVLLYFIIKCNYFTDFLEKRAEFPLFLDAPDNTSCRYFSKFSQDSNSVSISLNIS
ncbi:hypothetical protein Hanom_Chr12g01139261 [Helianthus anomalus]